MSKYSYTEMKKAATTHKRIGGYKGINVYAESKYRYAPERMKGDYYVLYDDDYKFVRDGWIEGKMDNQGRLDLWEEQRQWHGPVDFEKPSATKERSIPASDYSAFVAGAKEGDTSVPVSSDNWFADLDRQINELLATQFKFEGVEWAP